MKGLKLQSIISIFKNRHVTVDLLFSFIIVKTTNVTSIQNEGEFCKYIYELCRIICRNWYLNYSLTLNLFLYSNLKYWDFTKDPSFILYYLPIVWYHVFYNFNLMILEFCPQKLKISFTIHRNCYLPPK